MKLETFITNRLREKSYILYDEDTKDAICVDPGNSDNVILDFIKGNNLNLKYILLTHGHFDHIMGIKYLKETNAKIVAFKEEKEILEDNEKNGGGLYSIKTDAQADIYGDKDTVLDEVCFDIKLLETPGHTKGGACYYVPSFNIVFTGDTLFRETIGRYDFYSGDFDTLIGSIKENLFVLPDDTICCPGHGENTTIIHEKKHNQFFR